VLVRGAGFPFAWLDEVMHRADLSAALREVAGDAKFREAVTWQNRAAVVDGLDSLLRKPPGATDSKTRKKELLVVRYLQRYCAKNDTIGFFGPVGWARWGDGRFVPQARLIEKRQAFAEPWMARVLADALAARPALRPEATVHLPGHLRVKLPLKLPTSFKRVPRWMRGPVESACTVSFPVAICAQPLERLPKEAQPVRDALAALDGPHALNEKLETLERAFTGLTQHAPKRHEGRTYGGRGLVYEECRRALDLELSDAMRARVARPLSVVLDIARWYTHEVARTLQQRVERRFKRTVRLTELWQDTAPLFRDDRLLRPALKKLRAVCERLGPDLDEAESLVAKKCRAPHPGWPTARHHAPDLMWAADSAEAMLRGEGTPVLGELHPGVNPFTTLSVLAHAPDRAALEREWARDFPPGLISPVPWEDFARSSQDLRLAKQRWHLDLGFEFDSDLPPSRVLRAADFDVRRVRGALWAVHRERPLRFPLIQMFERRVKLIAATAFSLSDGSTTGPRRMLGDLVIQRARWRFTPEQLTWLDDGSDRLARAAAFCAQHGLPQRVFVRTPEEVKPLYVDWKAPLLVEMLARLARGAQWLSFSEMLPAPGELWLRDADGAPYVCELRCIAVDPLPHPSVQRDSR
jgi:hypothetical protein